MCFCVCIQITMMRSRPLYRAFASWKQNLARYSEDRSFSFCPPPRSLFQSTKTRMLTCAANAYATSQSTKTRMLRQHTSAYENAYIYMYIYENARTYMRFRIYRIYIYTNMYIYIYIVYIAYIYIYIHENARATSFD